MAILMAVIIWDTVTLMAAIIWVLIMDIPMVIMVIKNTDPMAIIHITGIIATIINIKDIIITVHMTRIMDTIKIFIPITNIVIIT